MNYFFSLAMYGGWGLLGLRLVVGAIFLAHGLAKSKMRAMSPSDQMPAAMLSKLKILSVVEPLGGLAMILGFLTPFAAIGLIIIMLGALYYKTQVWKSPFAATDKNGWEFDLLILASCLVLLLLGSGVLSLDALLGWR